MQRSKMKTGVVYGHWAGTSAHHAAWADAVVVLDTAVWHHARAWARTSPGLLWRGSGGKGVEGLPALICAVPLGEGHSVDVAGLEALAAWFGAALAAYTDGEPFTPTLPTGVRFVLVAPREVRLPWAEHLAERAAAQTARARIALLDAARSGDDTAEEAR